MSQLDMGDTLLQDEQLPSVSEPHMQPPVAVRAVQVRRVVTMPRVLFVVVVVALCMTLLYNQMHLTRLTKNIGEKEAALDDLKSEFVSLKTKQEQALSINYIEKYAQERLGMVKMDPSQVEYIELKNPEITEVSSTGTTLGDAVAGMMRSFTAVLEYLR